jgi:hypothetical protein
MAGADTIERLQDFLRALTPQARAMLLGEFERSLLRGEDLGAAEIVLQELRRIVREQQAGPPRIGHAARLFFKPLEPFLVDDLGQHRHPGRIARASLESLWTWIGRDLLPRDTAEMDELINAALQSGDDEKAQYLIRTLQDRAAVALSESIRSAATDEQVRRRMLAQIGTQRAEEDAQTLKCVLKARDGLNAMQARLPVQVGNLSTKSIDEYKALIEKTGAPGTELFLYSLLTVRSRLAAPWQLIRFGVKAAGSDTAARVAETPYGVSVNIVLSELERQVLELRDDLRSGRGVASGALLKMIHDSARGLRTELDLPVDSTWGRTLSGLRGQIGETLRAEIESMPGRVRRLLRIRSASNIAPKSTVDPQDAAETEALVSFVGTCRHFAGELAINEMTQRAYSDLQQFLDNNMNSLIDALRQSGPAERAFRKSQVEVAVRLCGLVFGKDFAAQFARAGEVAAATAEAGGARAASA